MLTDNTKSPYIDKLLHVALRIRNVFNENLCYSAPTCEQPMQLSAIISTGILTCIAYTGLREYSQTESPLEPISTVQSNVITNLLEWHV